MTFCMESYPFFGTINSVNSCFPSSRQCSWTKNTTIKLCYPIYKVFIVSWLEKYDYHNQQRYVQLLWSLSTRYVVEIIANTLIVNNRLQTTTFLLCL